MMGLSEVDRHAIEVIYKEKKLTAGQIVREFPGRNWKESTVRDLLKKIDATGSSDRIPGSGRPRTARTEENMTTIKRCAISDVGNPGTSKSEREIAGQLGIHQSSVNRAKNEMGMKTYTRIITPRITIGTRTRRGERAEVLSQFLNEELVPYCVFYDEKDVTLERPINRQTNKVCKIGGTKRDVSPERLFHEKSRFSKKLMVCGAVSYRGKSDLFVINPEKVKIDSEAYQQVLRKIFPSIRRLYPENDWIFIQDSAPSHRSVSTQSFLCDNCPAFVGADEWPPNSPDCNPLDYHVWNALQESLYKGQSGPFESLEQLEKAVKKPGRTCQWNQFENLLIASPAFANCG